jgi:hypothetical protein
VKLIKLFLIGHREWGYRSVIKYLPSMYRVIGLILNFSQGERYGD